MSARTVGLLLWLFVGGLAATAVFWQLKHSPQWPTVTGAAMRLPELPTVAPLAPFQLPSSGAYNEITTRPLFIAARRPEAPPPVETPPEKPPAPPGPEKKFLLLGVMITPSSTVALLRPEEPNAKTARVKPGETIGDWLLESAAPDRVVLRRGGATQELRLVHRRKPAGPRVNRPQGAVPPAAGVPNVPQPNALPQSITPMQPQPNAPRPQPMIAPAPPGGGEG